MPGFVPLPGSKGKAQPKAKAGAVDLTVTASLTLRIRSRGDLKELEAKVIHDASLPLRDRKYLDHEELVARYGADPADIARVEGFAHKNHLTVVHKSPAERFVVVKGKLSELITTFPANVAMYQHADTTYRAPTGEISLPQELDGIVVGVFGLNTRPKHRSPHRRRARAMGIPNTNVGVAATQFAQRYNFPAGDGTGQTIGIIELGGGYRESDLHTYFRQINVKLPSLAAVSVDHTGNKPSTPESADGEVMLDLEVAGSVAPAANLVVYFAPDDGDKGFIDALSAAIYDQDRKPSILSISWGDAEIATDQQGIAAYHELFVAAASLGITICVAAGDHGTADSDAAHWDGGIHVDHPASDDLVLSCGGTQIVDGVDVVWNDGTPFDAKSIGGGGWASGGGISQVFPVPAYQSHLKMPPSLVTGAGPGRGVPDIAMSATDYFTREDGTERASGGTSAVAPLMAALVARLNQAKGKNAGFLNPFLYANASAIFVDVTSGDNGIARTLKGYSAGPGWDACSGLGCPIGSAILKKL
jgi:kumamolisin